MTRFKLGEARTDRLTTKITGNSSNQITGLITGMPVPTDGTYKNECRGDIPE